MLELENTSGLGWSGETVCDTPIQQARDSPKDTVSTVGSCSWDSKNVLTSSNVLDISRHRKRKG
jgi:hypothetical protein